MAFVAKPEKARIATALVGAFVTSLKRIVTRVEFTVSSIQA